MSFTLSEHANNALQLLEQRYPHKKALALPLLWEIMKQEGYISEEAMQFAANYLNVPLSHVYGIVTFYTMFRTQPPQKHTIEICRTLSCALRGAAMLHEQLTLQTKALDVEILEVECLGACGGAPMCAIDGNYFENIDIEHLEPLLKVLT